MWWLLAPWKFSTCSVTPAFWAKCLEELAHQFGVEGADLGRRELHLPDKERPARDVDGGTGQRLVHGEIEAGIAGDAAAVAERLRDRLAENDAGVLNRVVVVDVQVAVGADGDVDQRMARQLVQHVIEEADPGLHVVPAGAVEIDGNRNAGFTGLAEDFRGARCHGLWPFPGFGKPGHIKGSGQLPVSRTRVCK